MPQAPLNASQWGVLFLAMRNRSKSLWIKKLTSKRLFISAGGQTPAARSDATTDSSPHGDEIATKRIRRTGTNAEGDRPHCADRLFARRGRFPAKPVCGPTTAVGHVMTYLGQASIAAWISESREPANRTRKPRPGETGRAFARPHVLEGAIGVVAPPAGPAFTGRTPIAILSGSLMPALYLMRVANCRQIGSALVGASSFTATVRRPRIASCRFELAISKLEIASAHTHSTTKTALTAPGRPFYVDAAVAALLRVFTASIKVFSAAMSLDNSSGLGTVSILAAAAACLSVTFDARLCKRRTCSHSLTVKPTTPGSLVTCTQSRYLPITPFRMTSSTTRSSVALRRE